MRFDQENRAEDFHATPIPNAKVYYFLRAGQIATVTAASLLLAATFGFLGLERSWLHDGKDLGPKDAFFNGTIGTELLPLPVLQVLPDLFPQHFGTGEKWIEQFGFLKPSNASELPLGFTVSNRRSQSGAPSPVKFVGFSCVLCHSTNIRFGEGGERLVVGPGNTSLNLFAWIDSLQAAALDEKRFTAKAVAEAYYAKTHQKLTFQESAMIDFWIKAFRRTLKDGIPKYDEPFGNGLSLTPDCVPTGPDRTQPFRTLVRRVLNRPGTSMTVYTKIASVYQEQLRKWAQFDGSIRDLNARSASAAFAAGATVDNLAISEIANNIREASEFTRTLRGPLYQDVFKFSSLDQSRLQRGKVVYMQSCNICHGHPEASGWVSGARQGEIVPLGEIKTDPERVNYRYYDEIPDRLFELFPQKHPFHFKREEIRPGPEGTTRGYINAPIDSAFSRAPYLHNASVLTLAELINLKPRREITYRGQNVYDPADVGLASPETPDNLNYFRFDTSLKGNSNKGHDYPRSYHSPEWNAEKLEDLLEYLKTL
jgi:hypothetical protein